MPGVVAMFSPMLERLHVGHRDREPAVAALQVVEQVVEAVDQVLAAGLERRLAAPPDWSATKFDGASASTNWRV